MLMLVQHLLADLAVWCALSAALGLFIGRFI